MAWLLLAVAVSAYYAVCGLLLLASLHANGWDLGFLTQMLWNTAHGRWWQHSFRENLYIGDHWSPALLMLVPLSWTGTGAAGLIVAQAALLGAAIVPLAAAARELCGQRIAIAVVLAYTFGLGVARAAAFDVHVEAFAPLLAFAALWALATGRVRIFAATTLGILLIKEDAVLLALALCWIAVVTFKLRTVPAAIAVVALAYALVVNGWLIPSFRGDESSALVLRYGYLGASAGEVLTSLITRPQVAFEQLAQPHIAGAMLLLLGPAFLALANVRLLPALVLVVIPPLLAASPIQSGLELHYMLVPALVATLLCVIALRDGGPLTARRVERSTFAWIWCGIAVAVFLVFSPLPPSLRVEWGRFAFDDHARTGHELLRRIPAEVPVSAQSAFVPLLAEREKIYQFPRVVNAEYVLTDLYGAVPADDLAAGYEDCLAALPRLGFDTIEERDGIRLWRKARPPERVPHVPVWCSDQRH